MTDGAETTDKAAIGRITWLGSEWRPDECSTFAGEGKAEQAGRPVARVKAAGVRAFIVPMQFSNCGRGGQQNRSEGREAGSWMREV
jgi:hypothetical protein